MTPAHWRSPLRWGTAILTIATLALATGTVHAAPPGNTTYRGITSNSAAITLATNADGKQTTLTWQEVGVEGGGCSGSGTTTLTHSTTDDTFFWGGNTTPVSVYGTRANQGYYGDAGAAAGGVWLRRDHRRLSRRPQRLRRA